jgi:predicted nucleotide-binding protein
MKQRKKNKRLVTRRIFISSPRDEYLEPRRVKLKAAIIKAIKHLGYDLQQFGSSDGGKGLAAGTSWSPSDAERVMTRCVGAVILGFPIWKASSARRTKRNSKTLSLASEYNHYEGALAWSHGLPILSVLEESVEERVAFNRYGNAAVVRPPRDADENWVKDKTFKAFLEGWHRRMHNRKDVFLGYCSTSKSTAAAIKRFITKNCRATVLDWIEDFIEGRTILAEIQEAARRTTGGIFLFTEDDPLPGAPEIRTAHKHDQEAELAAPRDNVVFEAGFFASAKGPNRVLIIRGGDAKMPADLGGDIYAPLPDDDRKPQDIKAVKEPIRRFLQRAL